MPSVRTRGRSGARARPRPRPLSPVAARAAGYAAAAWCLGFAAASVWQITAGPIRHPGPHQRYAAYASGLAVISVLVLVIKLAGAAVALAAVLVRPGRSRRSPGVIGVGLWGPSGC